jgi:TolB-like protein/cytochrome c-type biogenesis protein CcmH/NrfG
MQSYDLLMRGLFHINRFNPEDNAIGIGLLRECLERDPNNAIVHNHIYQAYVTEFLSGWHDPRSESLDNAGFHVTRAMELDPDIALIQADFAEYSLFTEDWDVAELHTDRALRLNPNDPETLATAAAAQASLGNVSKAIELADACHSLDPFHPWIDWVAGVAYYRGKRYEDALVTFKNMPIPADEIDGWLAACYQRLGDHEKASKHLDLYLEIARKNMARFPKTLEDWNQLWKASPSYRPGEGIDYPFDALCEAGLKQFVESSFQNDMPSIAVLPFENMSGDPEQEYFSEGITSDIIATLSRFRGMHVVARHSTLVYKERKASLEEIATEQQVRYILEGSIRKSGNRIRVNAELIDSHSGENCWSESYDRDLDDIFAVQDEITLNIAVAMKVHLNAGDRARVHASGTKSIKAWELCTRAAELEDSYIRDNINQARGLVKSALELDPNYSFAWTTLGWTHWQAAYLAWTDSIDDCLDEAEIAARKALELDPESADAWFLTGTIQQLRGQSEEAIAACQKAVSIAPGNAEGQALLAYSLAHAGEYDKALPFHEASLRLAPICPNWYLLVGGVAYFGKGLLQRAIETFQRAIDVEPESPLARIFLMDALLEAGKTEKARIIAEEIRSLDNDFKVAGIIRSISSNLKERNRFQSNLETMGFTE